MSDWSTWGTVWRGMAYGVGFTLLAFVAYHLGRWWMFR
jgi:hypothetical protein